MTVEELIEILTAIEDKSISVVFPIGEEHFVSPCPYECSIMTLGPLATQVDDQGNFIPGEDEEAWSEEGATKLYALMPHNPNNPHPDGDEDEPLS